MTLCLCGCHQEVKEGNRFVNGHNSRMPERIAFLKGSKMRQIASETANRPEHISFLKSPEWREMSRIVGSSPENLARLKSVEHRQIVSDWANRPEHQAFLKSREWKKLASLSGKKFGKQNLITYNKSQKGRQKSSETASRPEHIKYLLSIKRPSDLEQRVFALIMYYVLPYDFVGDGRLLIGTPNIRDGRKSGLMCPDFKHWTKNIVVEVSKEDDKIYRRGFVSRDHYEQVRRDHFSNYNYDSLFLWSDMSDEVMVNILKIST